MVSLRRTLQAVATLWLLLATIASASASPANQTCAPEPIRELIVAIAPGYTVALPRIANHTLVIEVGAENQDWRGILTLNVAEGTVYTSVGGEKLTPQLRPKLQALVEKAAATPSIREVLKRCAETTVKQAERASTEALQSQLDADKKKAPEPTSEELSASNYITVVLPGLWALLILAALAALWRRRRDWNWRTAAVLGTLSLFGLLLRVMIPPWGPGDISNTVSGVQTGAEHIMDFGHYGRGIEGLLILVQPLIGAGEDSLVGINLAVATMAIPLMFALARRIGYETNTAHFSALLLALAPLHVRFGPTYNRYIVFVFLMLLGWTMLLAYLSTRNVGDIALSVCALALGLQCRPEAAVLPLAGIGLVVAYGMRREGRTDIMSVKWALLIAFGVLIATVIQPVSAVLETAGQHQRWAEEYIDKGRPLFDPDFNAFLSPWLSPLPWVALALWGLLRPPRENRWMVAWLAAMALGFSAIVGTRDLGTSHVIDARYHLSALPFYLILTASGATALTEWVQSRLPERRRFTPVAVGLTLVASTWSAMPSASLRTTMNQEYEFVREHLRLVPEDCTIVAYEPDYDLGLRAPFHLSGNLGLSHHWQLEREFTPSAFEKKPCVVYYHTASCSTVTDVEHDQQGQDGMCAKQRAQHKGVLAETDVDAIPAGAYVYKTDPIPVGFYWLKRP